MKVLGIDPGIATTGWGVVEETAPQKYAGIGFGCFTTSSRSSLMDRLGRLARQLRELIRREKPDAVAVEELFFAKDSRTAASVGHARGVILYVLGELGMSVQEYNPRQVKIALTGYGGADKSQMQRMVQTLLRLRSAPKPDDAADALAIALCHLNTRSHSNEQRVPSNYSGRATSNGQNSNE